MPASLPRTTDGSLIAPVSVKAVVLLGGSVLLGENERDEWELLGGRPEPGETFESAVIRELQEEAGLLVHVGSQVLDEPFEVVPGRIVRIVAFRCEPVGEPLLEASDEHRGVAFVAPERLPDLALPAVYRRAIDAAHPPTDRR